MPKEFRPAVTEPHVRKAETIKRLTKVYGVPGFVEVTMSADGLAFRVPGSRRYVTTTWLKAVEHASPEANTPAWLANDPVKLLVTEEAKAGKRKQKRLDKEAASVQ